MAFLNEFYIDKEKDQRKPENYIIEIHAFYLWLKPKRIIAQSNGNNNYCFK